MTVADHPITGRRLGHLRALDGLRAVAALAVVGFHARIGAFANGDIGVDIFFVLSGFLITSILISRSGRGSRIDFRDFYRRRALRLLPAYFSVVVICVLLQSFSHYGGTFRGAAASSVYVANWAIAVGNMKLGLLAHTWSLSVEEQFYLIWPALLGFLLYRSEWNGRTVLAAVLALVVTSWLAVIALATIGASATIASNATPTRAVELLLGGSLAIFVATPSLSGPLGRCPSRSVVAVAGVSAGILLLGLIPVSGTSDYVNSIIGWPIISVLTCAVIYACMRDVALLRVPLSTRAMTAVGKRSYGLYLWHFPIFVVIDTRWGLGSWGAKLSAMAITVIVVALSYRFIERPFLDRKEARRPASNVELPSPIGDVGPLVRERAPLAALEG